MGYQVRPFVCILASTFAFIGFAQGVKPAKEIAWRKTFAEATESAKASNALIMIDFYTDWCVWCKRLDADTYPDAKVIAKSRLVAPIRLNAEKEDGKDLAKKYAVTGYPTIVFVDATGEQWGRIGGYEPPEQFAADMEKAISGYREYPSLNERVTKTTGDVAAAARLAEINAGRGDEKGALDMLARAEAADPTLRSKFLAGAYNAVGDYYQGLQKYPEARGYFEKGIKASKTGRDTAYARISIAACFMTEGKPKDAAPYLEAILAQKDAPQDIATDAKRMLAQLNAGSKGG